jgi:putative ABC transport system permease protein
VFDLARATVAHRKGGFAAAFIALLAGSAVITACGVLLLSGLVTAVAPERYAAASVMLGGRQHQPVPEDFDRSHAERATLPATAAARAAAVPGVRRAVPDLSFPLTLLDRLGGVRDTARPLYGHGWSSAALGHFRLTEGREPRGDRETVLDTATARAAGARTGDTVRLATGTSPAAYTVTGLVTGTGREAAAFFGDTRAAALFPHPGRLTAVGVLAGPGTDPAVLAARLERALPGTTAYTGDRTGDLEFLHIGQSRGFLIALSASFGGTALAVVVFVVSSTLGLGIHQRRRELAMLRAIAATPRQVHRMIGGETLLVGLAAAVPGALLGYPVAGLLRDAFAAAGALPPDLALSRNPLPAAASVLLCVLAARLAGYVSARRVARIRPVEALGESRVDPPEPGRGRLVTGTALVTLGTAGSLALPLAVPGEAALAAAGGSVLVLMTGTALLGPRLVRATARLLGPLLGRSRVSGFLAAANSSANARRLSGAVVPLALGTAMALLQLTMAATTRQEAADQTASGVVAHHVITGDRTGLSPGVAAEAARLPGVATATPVARTQVLITFREFGSVQTDSFGAQGIEPRGLHRTLDLDVREGSLGGLRGDTVALSRMAAGTTGLGVGDTASISLGDGTPKRLKVVAVYGNGLGFGDVTLPHRLVSAHTTTGLDTAVLVAADPAARDRAAAGLAALAGARPALLVQDADSFTANQEGEHTRQSWVNLIANALLLLYILIAVVNTLVMATTARVREFAMLRLIGTTGRQTRRMAAMESAVVILTAVAAGVLIALPPVTGVALALTGTPVPAVEPLVWAAVLGSVAVLARLATAVPVRLALRTRPVDAISLGE